MLPLLSALASWTSHTVHCCLCILLCAYNKVTSLLYSPRAPGSTPLAFCMLNPLLHTCYLCWLSCYLCLCHFNKSLQAAFELSRHYPSPQPFASLQLELGLTSLIPIGSAELILSALSLQCTLEGPLPASATPSSLPFGLHGFLQSKLSLRPLSCILDPCL